MALPKEPRQKMITIMYLVLTALLALNVSKQIVHAFVVVNTGLQKTNANTVSQNLSIHQKFDEQYKKDQKGTQRYRDAANTVTQKADELVKYIQDLKGDLVKKVDGDPWTMDKADTMLEYVTAQEDFTTPTGILLGDGDDPTGKPANLLKKKIGDYRKALLQMFSNKDICVGGYKDTLSINLGLLTPMIYSPGEGKQTWEYYYFGDAPLVSDVVTFTKLQADVRNSEAAMLNYFYSQIGATSVKVSSFIGKILPQSTYVLLGDSFKADIFPTAIMNTLPPKIEVGDSDKNAADPSKEGTQIKVSADGVGRYTFKTEKEGPAKVFGIIRIPDPVTGKPVAYPFTTEYIVAKPAVTISPTEMNVFYAGIPNPVDISAAGFGPDQIRPSMSYGSISKASGGGGKYTVNCTADQVGKDATITVVATKSDGSHTNMPAQHFKIKSIPSPTLQTSGKSGDGPIPKVVLTSLPMVKAVMPADFNFQGVSFTVMSFTMSVGKNGLFSDDNSSGPGGRFTPKMLSDIQQTPKGGYILIQNVVVKGPDGRNRTIGGQVIKVN